MQAGDIFTLTDDAVDRMENWKPEPFSVVWKDKAKQEHRLADGTQFRITTKGLKGMPVEVRASKIDESTGKATKGRPRRFPASLVAELLGEDFDGGTPDTTDDASDLSADSQTPQAAVTEYDSGEESQEDAEARVNELLGLDSVSVGDDSTVNDW